MTAFHSNRYKAGHNATDYDRWVIANASYEVSYQRGYEPWGIMHRRGPLLVPLARRHVSEPLFSAKMVF